MKQDYSVALDLPTDRIYLVFGTSTTPSKDQKPTFCAAFIVREGVTDGLPVLSLCLETENATAIVRTIIELITEEQNHSLLTVISSEKALLENLCGSEPRILKWRKNGGKNAQKKPVHGFEYWDALYKHIESGRVIITLPEGDAVWSVSLLGKTNEAASDIRENSKACMLGDDEIMIGTDLFNQIKQRQNLMAA